MIKCFDHAVTYFNPNSINLLSLLQQNTQLSLPHLPQHHDMTPTITLASASPTATASSASPCLLSSATASSCLASYSLPQYILPNMIIKNNKDVPVQQDHCGEEMENQTKLG